MRVVKDPIQAGQKSRSFLTGFRYLFNNRHARRFARKTRRAIKNTMESFGQEARETREMARFFFRMLEKQLALNDRKTPPSPEEVKRAIEQLKDIGRISIFASISLIPGGGFSLIGLELLARRFGIRNFTFLPSSFRTQNRRFRPRSYGIKGKVQPPKEELSEKEVPGGNTASTP